MSVQRQEVSPALDDVPLVEIHSPYIASIGDQHHSASTSSILTHSDKLSELPSSTPPVGRSGNPRSSIRIRRAESPSHSAHTLGNSPPTQTHSQNVWESSPASTGHIDTSTSTHTQTQMQQQTRLSDNEGRNSSNSKRLSFESDRISISLPSFPNVRQAMTRLSRATSSSQERVSSQTRERDRDILPSSPSHSPTRSRPNTPLRILWPLNRIHSREEPFLPIDPYNFLFKCKGSTISTTLDGSISEVECELPTFSLASLTHLTDQLLRQAYRHLLLRLPSIYFSRVCRLFENAEVSKPEIDRLIERAARGEEFPGEWDWSPPSVSPALGRFKKSWEEFVDNVLKEWKTLNLVSALLLSAILTLLQISSANTDPVTRTSALLSLIAALWSLCFGCIYILRFGTMKNMYKASRWAEESQNTKTSMWWNVWVLLATPAVWLAWSMICFVVSILSFVWRADFPAPTPTSTSIPSTDSSKNTNNFNTGGRLGPQIAISCLFVVGFVYFILVLRTFRNYGGGRRAWKRRDLNGNGVGVGNMGYEDGDWGGEMGMKGGRRGGDHGGRLGQGQGQGKNRNDTRFDTIKEVNSNGNGNGLGLMSTVSRDSRVSAELDLEKGGGIGEGGSGSDVVNVDVNINTEFREKERGRVVTPRL